MCLQGTSLIPDGKRWSYGCPHPGLEEDTGWLQMNVLPFEVV